MIQRGNNGIVRYKTYVAGWLDSSIGDFLEDFPATFKSMSHALVTCLDSNLAPASLIRSSPKFKPIAKVCRTVGKGILLPTSNLREISSDDELFFGFDEVWFFPTGDITAKPDSAWLVGPNRVDQSRLNSLGRWMADNRCTLGLGDGSGMNLVLKAHGLMRTILAHSMSHPILVA